MPPLPHTPLPEDLPPLPREDHPVEALTELFQRYPRWVVLTGAGCSTEAGIPDYRGPSGVWRSQRPVLLADFLRSHHHRQRYWARSLVGWRHFGVARPAAPHHKLAHLERAGRIPLLVTQNVDRLHQEAGHQEVLELHGTNHQVVCLQCRAKWFRVHIQAQMEQTNPHWLHQRGRITPDGDADPGDVDYSTFIPPRCEACGGILKPDVVFFGESVPRERVELVHNAVKNADGLLVVGSSLMVWSGLRFVLAAREWAIPTACINDGITRADGGWTVKVAGPCGKILTDLVGQLGG